VAGAWRDAALLAQKSLASRAPFDRTATADSQSAVDEHAADLAVEPTVKLLIFQFGVGVYGGYFGAGIGILTLAALGFMGYRTSTA
jgi:uncharacterized membrane protein YfcA